ncbi:hypothetical protein ABZY05_00640, partial [Streptomyces canus]|uniref:hypothetical protein n=1 Tax=Streptomyces canus TaxID=58343 RepID=UPI0033A06640
MPSPPCRAEDRLIPNTRGPAHGHPHRPGQPALTHTEDNPANRTTTDAGGGGKTHHACGEPDMTDTHATATPGPTATGHPHR